MGLFLNLANKFKIYSNTCCQAVLQEIEKSPEEINSEVARDIYDSLTKKKTQYLHEAEMSCSKHDSGIRDINLLKSAIARLPIHTLYSLDFQCLLHQQCDQQ